MARSVIGLDIGTEGIKSLALEASFRSRVALWAKREPLRQLEPPEDEERPEEIIPGVFDREGLTRSLLKVKPAEISLGDLFAAGLPQSAVCARPQPGGMFLDGVEKIHQGLHGEFTGPDLHLFFLELLFSCTG